MSRYFKNRIVSNKPHMDQHCCNLCRGSKCLCGCPNTDSSAGRSSFYKEKVLGFCLLRLPMVFLNRSECWATLFICIYGLCHFLLGVRCGNCIKNPQRKRFLALSSNTEWIILNKYMATRMKITTASEIRNDLVNGLNHLRKDLI